MKDIDEDRPHAVEPGYILVVDDDASIRDVVQAVLEDEGYTVRSAAHGRDALQLLRSGTGVPQLILLDLMMPVMNGWEFRAAQQADLTLAAVPVVVLSADRDVALKAAELRVPAFLTKPVSLIALLDVVERFCP
jgi:CheY-like chemotaxis protein